MVVAEKGRNIRRRDRCDQSPINLRLNGVNTLLTIKLSNVTTITGTCTCRSSAHKICQMLESFKFSEEKHLLQETISLLFIWYKKKIKSLKLELVQKYTSFVLKMHLFGGKQHRWWYMQVVILLIKNFKSYYLCIHVYQSIGI